MLYSHSIGKFVIIRRSLVTKVPSIKFPTEKFNAKVSYWMQMYEEFVGLTEVKAAQSRVLDVSIHNFCFFVETLFSNLFALMQKNNCVFHI